MDNLPNNWKLVQYAEVTTKIGDVDHKMPKETSEGYPYVSPRDFLPNNQIDYINAKKISLEDYIELSRKIKPEKGDIIFARYGTIGENRFVNSEIEFLASYSCAIIKHDLSKVLPKFSYYYSISPQIKIEIEKYINKSTQPNIGIQSISKFSFPLPPLAEQLRITNKIESLFENIDKSIDLLEENIKHTQALIASTLEDVFKDAESNENNNSTILSNVVRVINGRAYKQEELLNEGKYPVLRVGNFFTNRSWYYSNLELEEDKYCENGDLLYAWSASFGPKIWNGTRSIFHYHIWKMEILSNELTKDYLYYLLLRDTEKIKEEGGRGVGMIHITKGDIEKRKIVIPTLKTQHLIVNKLKGLNDITQQIMSAQQSRLTYLKALKASILDKAFKGEL